MGKGGSSEPVVRFGPFEANLKAGELRKHGMKLKLVGQPLEVLAVLLERPGEVVTRQELRTKLWPGDTFTDFDHGLNAAVNKLREALNDSADQPKYVETLPRRGYRFIGAVDLPDTQELKPALPETQPSSQQPALVPERQASARRYRPVLVTGVVVAVVLAVVFSFDAGGIRPRWLGEPSPARIQSIVVLPLANLSKDPDQEYFADGMTDQLITNLAQISALKVISRTSAMRYKATNKSLSEIAQELHVDGVVEGAVMREGGRVRISAQLIEAQTDHHLWAASYERDLQHVLSVQDEVTRAIVSEIRVKLTAQEQARLANTRPINPEAYQLYLMGRYYWNKRTQEGAQKGMEYFQEAISKDPVYAPAYTGLADSYEESSIFGWLPPREAMPKARAAALKALEIDDDLAEAHASLAVPSFQYDWDWPTAQRHFDRALALSPGSGTAHLHFLYSMYLSALGRSEQAEVEAKRQLDLDPVSPLANYQMGVQLYRARRFDQAIEQGRKALELDPNFPLTNWLLGSACLGKGMFREALMEYEKYLALSHGSALALGYVGHARGRLGDRGQALRVLGELRALSKQRFVSAYYFALVYAGMGEREQAFAWLEKACEERAGQIVFLKVDVEWDPLRSDPRFADLVRRVGLQP